MKETDVRVIKLIIEKIERLNEICSNHSFEEVANSFILSDSLQYEFEKMHFDIQKLLPEFYILYPSFPIDKIRGIRNRVAHDYESVILSILYNAVIYDLPSVKQVLLSLIENN